MNNLSTKAKVLISLNVFVLALAGNKAVQDGVSAFVGHHPWLAVLGGTVATVAHLFTDAKSQ